MAEQAQNWDALSGRARAFIRTIVIAGTLLLGFGLAHWSSHDPAQFVSYLAIAIIASRLKVKLPGIAGTMSVNFLFILLGVVELSLGETLLIGCAATLAQCLFADRPRGFQVAFNVASVSMATALAFGTFHC